MEYKYNTIPYKGSKRKLLNEILSLTQEINAETFFDGFSGTGIVSANMRNHGLKVWSNDLSYSSNIFSHVFLNGFDEQIVYEKINLFNKMKGTSGWLTKNYSGSIKRKVRCIAEEMERPKAFIEENAQILDEARDYIDKNNLNIDEKNALIFSVILTANKVYNGTNDQKSSLKSWSPNSQIKISSFIKPTIIEGPKGFVMNGDILKQDLPKVDVAYYDPPYTTGVLYPACYHLNDSLAYWDKPKLDYSYALPRPERATFSGKDSQAFYSKRTAKKDFILLIEKTDAKRIIFSYSDAPRNSISIEDFLSLSKKFGKVEIKNKDHRICSQPNSLKKISTSLKEYFIIIDK